MEKIKADSAKPKNNNMAVTILECLQNAQINLVENYNLQIAVHLGRLQLNNAIILLEKGYNIDDEVDPLLEKYGEINNVPFKSTN